MKKALLFSFLFFLCAGVVRAQIITTVAGDSTHGYNGDSIEAKAAELYEATGVAVDHSGNIYIADRNNNRIRMVNTAGIITSIAGTGVASYSGDGGPATAAEIDYPYGIAVDTLGNIYFSDDNNYRIRKINSTGIITTIAGTGVAGYNGDGISATAAQIKNTGGLAIDHNLNVIFCDGSNNRVRKIDAVGMISTIAGDGSMDYNGDNIPATAAKLAEPSGIAIDDTGNIYIADSYNYRVRKIDATGMITTIAGTGMFGYNGDNISATSAQLYEPLGVAIDKYGNIYIGDTNNDRVRMINTTGIISTIAGSGLTLPSGGDGGPAVNAIVIGPVGLAIDNSGYIYIAEGGASHIRKIGSTVSVSDLRNDQRGILIYPNPSGGQFVINVPSVIDEDMDIMITSMSGEVVRVIKWVTNKPLSVHLDLATGVYLLSAHNPHAYITEKIIVQN